MSGALLDPQNQLELVDPRLRTIIGAAAGRLPEGWRVLVVEVPSPTAIELRLVNPQQRRLGGYSYNQRGAAYDAYRQLADLAFGLQHRLYPELDGELGWGGNFTDSAFRWQLGHFDLSGFRGRGRYKRPQDRVGSDSVRRDARSGAPPSL